jgi:protein-tyrosine phosphatase
MTKPVKIAAGIAAAGAIVAALAAASRGIAAVCFAWIALACAVASLAYLLNRPGWLGKAAGSLALRRLVLLPYLIAFRIACRAMRWWRSPDQPTRVAPGVWVAGRVEARTLPPGVATVVDLVAEYAAERGIRELPGYRSLPVLDGGVPPDPDRFVALVYEVAMADGGDVLVHCDSGRGRAPTFAAALLVARGLAADVEEALVRMRLERPVVAPTRTDLEFLASVMPRLRIHLEARAGAARISVDLGSLLG